MYLHSQGSRICAGGARSETSDGHVLSQPGHHADGGGRTQDRFEGEQEHMNDYVDYFRDLYVFLKVPCGSQETPTPEMCDIEQAER